ncbi:MAG TPA: family 20 glycosylhydrolase [Pyrinomonadaceae bacterium]|nr:family 20 glycosylhydrolase [Pyrinomonadaceae bacterium]
MKHLFTAIAVSLSLISITSAQSSGITVIPKVVDYERKAGAFILSPTTRIVIRQPRFRQNAEFLRDQVLRRYGFKLNITTRPQKRDAIVFDLVGQGYAALREKGEYHLVVDDQLVRVMAGPEGQFYALQTLLQLMPIETARNLKLQATTIYEAPRFKYRGMHLDVSRHFQPVEFVKKFIDQMAQYKFNTFHWHLTDDQGWRIEIKKYPRLTTVGQYRSESHEGSYSTIFKGDGRPIEGFYTQQQIREVVAYAKERYITVIPEIELPGHASAALAAYPELGAKCAPPDHKFEVKKTWGIFKEVFCPTDETFKFLEDVLDETIKLFPDSPYIHIGGDEVLKDYWKESAFVQELKKRENLKDENEVQAYFIRRIEKFVNSKGKKIIGWDEILEGGIAPTATIMSWRGMRGGIAAAKAGHDVIMTPTDFVYFDYGQGDPAYEPLNIGSYVPLSKVYSFEPVPPELTAEEAKYILGGQANIWTEYIETPQQVEYMAFPRMLALSEVLWSRKEDRDFADFQRRLNAILPRLDKQGVNYRIPEPGGLQNIVTEDESVSITLKPAPGTVVIYTTDGSTPDVKTSEQYYEPIEITVKHGEVKTLKTIVINAAGRKSVVYAATIVRGKMLEADKTDASRPGLSYEFFVPRGDMPGEGEKTNGETRSTNLNQFAQRFDLNKPFAITFDGYFRVPEDGVYEFQVDSTWDATVVLGSEMIINDAGTVDRKIRSAIVPLKAGLHKMSLRYNHRGGDPHFRFRWGIKGRGLTQAWGGEFVH